MGKFGLHLMSAVLAVIFFRTRKLRVCDRLAL